jgi:SAM-dependent methyltransferase
MNGYQASVLASWGCVVRSIDVAPAPGPQHFEVERYDGLHLPSGDATLDRVFSSNVLEHVPDLPSLLREIARVLRPGGLAVHLMPSAAWRFWHSVAHYAYLVEWLFGTNTSFGGGSTAPELGDFVKRKGVGWMIRRALWAGPHGEHPSAVSELYYFSRARWTKVFEEAGFHVVAYLPGGLFYTGYGILPGRFDAAQRAALARRLGSACHVFVTEPR